MNQKSDVAAVVEAAAGHAPDAAAIAAMAKTYRDLLGFLPPRVSDRFNVTGVLDPRSVQLQEAMRDHAMETHLFDAKTVQLIRAQMRRHLDRAAGCGEPLLPISGPAGGQSRGVCPA
jgi:hypothetical protein